MSIITSKDLLFGMWLLMRGQTCRIKRTGEKRFPAGRYSTDEYRTLSKHRIVIFQCYTMDLQRPHTVKGLKGEKKKSNYL